MMASLLIAARLG